MMDFIDRTGSHVGRLWSLCLSSFFVLSLGGLVSADDMCLRLPTENRALFEDKNEEFFMYVDRVKDGVNLRPWQGGAYGFVRTEVETPQGKICRKFHEGIDIKPIHRASDGVPQDIVRPIAPGRVVHASATPGHSSYGRYVVVEHPTEHGPFYSLYAHLGKVECAVGDQVGTGNSLGILGYSGTGLNKERAHVHLELCLMVNPEGFESWHKKYNTTQNYHGRFNGLNLAGVDLTPLLKECKDGKRVDLATYISSMPIYYVVRIPSETPLPIVKTYPFLLKSSSCPPEKARSWDVSFTGEGIPVSVVPSAESVAEPTLLKAKATPINPLYRTVDRIKSLGGGAYELTASGKRYAELFGFKRDESP